MLTSKAAQTELVDLINLVRELTVILNNIDIIGAG